MRDRSFLIIFGRNMLRLHRRYTELLLKSGVPEFPLRQYGVSASLRYANFRDPSYLQVGLILVRVRRLNTNMSFYLQVWLATSYSAAKFILLLSGKVRLLTVGWIS